MTDRIIVLEKPYIELIREQLANVQVPDSLPVLPLRDMVAFPETAVPLVVGRESSVKAVYKALGTNSLLLALCQRSVTTYEPCSKDLSMIGTIAVIMRMIKLDNGRLKVMLWGWTRARVTEASVCQGLLQAEIKSLNDTATGDHGPRVWALLSRVQRQTVEAARLGIPVPKGALEIIGTVNHPGRLADIVASIVEMDPAEAQDLLETRDGYERLGKVASILSAKMKEKGWR